MTLSAHLKFQEQIMENVFKKGVLSILIFISASISFSRCDSDYKVRTERASDNEAFLMGILWQQKSAEYRALVYQSFNIAKVMIDRESKKKRLKKKSVVIDIDETVLDNSPYQAKALTTNQDYPRGWKEWCNLAKAREVPGAKEFLQYAVSKGFDIFYVSNRESALMESTIKNLRTLGFPQVEKNHILLREDFSSKKERWETIEKTHYIAILLGDNLNDFSDTFENRSIEERFTETDRYQRHFGRRFIVLPNPVYGDWEGALYNYRRDLSKQQKNKIRINHLEGY
jgi:5'-nucleotidase (lipoprotein e(P4) family)